MSVCVYSVFVLFCVQVAALRRADSPSEGAYRLCIGLRNRKSGQGPTKNCRSTNRLIEDARIIRPQDSILVTADFLLRASPLTFEDPSLTHYSSFPLHLPQFIFYILQKYCLNKRCIVFEDYVIFILREHR
jgi:hypothetical protein